MSRSRLPVSVAILAHNEEALIERVAHAYLTQITTVADIVEVVVMSCGSTDGTDAMSARLAAANPLLRLVSRPQRNGKLGAIEAFAAQARGEILVLAAADAIPANTAVEELIRPFTADQECGMTGAQVTSHADRGGLSARLHTSLWRLHHELALRMPKLGEVVAIRAQHLRGRLPQQVHCDEVLLEARVRADGARLQYVPTAVVINFAPATVNQLFRQRRRIACQHAAAWYYLHYQPASSQLRLLVRIVTWTLGRRPRSIVSIAALAGLEILARTSGRVDFLRGKRYRTWTPVARPVILLGKSASDD